MLRIDEISVIVDEVIPLQRKYPTWPLTATIQEGSVKAGMGVLSKEEVKLVKNFLQDFC